MDMITRRQFIATAPSLSGSALAISDCSQESESDSYEGVASRTWQLGALSGFNGAALSRTGSLCHAGPIQPQHAVLEVCACWRRPCHHDPAGSVAAVSGSGSG